MLACDINLQPVGLDEGQTTTAITAIIDCTSTLQEVKYGLTSPPGNVLEGFEPIGGPLDFMYSAQFEINLPDGNGFAAYTYYVSAKETGGQAIESSSTILVSDAPPFIDSSNLPTGTVGGCSPVVFEVTGSNVPWRVSASILLQVIRTSPTFEILPPIFVEAGSLSHSTTLPAGSYFYLVTITDSDGDSNNSTIGSFVVAEETSGPAAITGAPNASVPGKEITVSASGCGGDFSWEILKDGQFFTDGDYNSLSFIPDSVGNYSVRLFNTSQVEPIATASIAVLPTVTDGVNYLVGGSPGSDNIQLSPNDVPAGTLAISIYGGDGNDDIQVAGSITANVWIYGGPGNDRLKGGGGHDVLMGEAGDDLLMGRDGRDILIGGLGADRIIGNAHDDILVSGVVVFDDLELALMAIQSEWVSERSYEQRTQNIVNGTGSLVRSNGSYFLTTQGTSPTVLHDAVKDTLTGDDGTDWYFANLDESSSSKDKITDLADSEFFPDIDFILGP